MRRVLITGAAGFIGRALAKGLHSSRAAYEVLRLDRRLEDMEEGGALEGDLTDAATLREIAALAPDVVFHLASAPGGASEHDPALSRRVNLDASLDLFDTLAATGRNPRVVYASSIAVYGEMGAAPVSRDTPAQPLLTYGAHKRMVEIALADFSRRGALSGIALRLPGVIARPRGAGFGSAFMSDLPRAVAEGRPYLCPVSPCAAAWWMSARQAAANLLRAAEIEVTDVFQLPALHLSIADVVDALARLFGEERRKLVQYSPDPRVEALYGRYPELRTDDEEALGFTSDGSAEDLLHAALEAN